MRLHRRDQYAGRSANGRIDLPGLTFVAAASLLAILGA